MTFSAEGWSLIILYLQVQLGLVLRALLEIREDRVQWERLEEVSDLELV